MTTRRTDRVDFGDAGQMDLHVWLPDAGSGPAILLLQEIFGVGAYIEAVAGRLADAGYVVGAPDVFWRFAPGWSATHDQAGLGASVRTAQRLDAQVAIADCVVAAAHLAARPETTGVPGVLGFCLGGTLATGVAIEASPSVCVSYYGSGVPAMVDRFGEIECPTLFHFGATDAYIPAAGVDAVAAAIDRPGLVLNVEAAGHAFDNHEAEMFYDADAAAAAWSKTMAFLAQHLPT